jgi:hypothetical protein
MLRAADDRKMAGRIRHVTVRTDLIVLRSWFSVHIKFNMKFVYDLIAILFLYAADNKVWGSVCAIHFALCLAYGIYQGSLLLEALGGQVKNPLQHEEGR